MAAPTDSGYGLGVTEGKTVDIDDVDRQGLKTVTGLSAEDPVGLDDKNGSDACPEEADSDDQEEVQVAKKPRMEKAENGSATEGAEDAGYGIDAVEDIVEKDDTEHHNGTAEAVEGEEEDSENGVVGAAEDEPAEDAAVSGKDAPGDVGLRTLLQEGDNTKTAVANHGADATHMLNGAK